MKILTTNTAIYSVAQNEAGTLNVQREYIYKNGQWAKDGHPIQNAGMFINQQGGIEGLLGKCKWNANLEADVAYWNKKLKAEHDKAHDAAMVRKARYEKQYREEYERLFSGEVTESNEETVGALLRYLNLQNWGGWNLPKMTIGYACHQYDCDGKIATTIKLDRPIMVNGEAGTMFQVGAPHGHLNKYRRI